MTVIAIVAVASAQRPWSAESDSSKRAKAGLDVQAPSSDPLIMVGKLLVAFKDDPNFRPIMRGQVDGAGLADDRPAEQIRAAMLLLGTGYPDVSPAAPAGSLFPVPPGPSIADRLSAAEQTLAADSPLHADIAALRRVLAASDKNDQISGAEREQRVAAAVGELDEQVMQGLLERHGWFSEVLQSAANPDAPVRVTARKQAGVFIVVAVIAGGTLGLAALAGTVLWIVAIVQLIRGRLRTRFERPSLVEEPFGLRTVWLETVLVFVGGFGLLKVMQTGLVRAGVDGSTITWAALVGQVLLATAIFWPVARGMPWAMWKQRIGWTARPAGSAGIAREVGFGILSYCLALPVVFATLLILLIIAAIVKAMTGKEIVSADGAERVQELVQSGDVWVTVMIMFLAVVWAPIVEESIFRGALFRHLRRRFPVLVAGLTSALVFAVMHSYGPLQLVMVGVLGTVFALVREWRGSLIPSTTAHFIQNSLAMVMLSLLGPMMRG